MKRRRADLIKVGLFVLVAGATLVGGLLWIAGSHLLRPVDTYTVLFKQSVTGLTAGANVEYQGVVVGRVRHMALTKDIPPNVAVVVDIDPGTPLRADTRAALIGSIVTGIKYIQLEGGTEAAAPLVAGGTIPGDVPSLEEFRERFVQIADRAVRILRRFDDEVLTPGNVKKLGEVVDELGAFAANLNQAMDNLRTRETARNLGQIVERVNDITVKLDHVLGDFEKRSGGFYGNLETAVQSIDGAARATGRLAETLASQVQGPPGRSVGDLVAELNTTAARLQEMIDVIRSDPSTLVWGRKVPEREFER